MYLEEFIKENLEVCELFSTKSKLFRYLGFPPTRSQHTMDFQEKTIRRFIDFDKTKNILKEANVPPNQIMITEKYDEPKIREDKRISEQNQKLIEELKKIIMNLEKDRISYSKIIEEYIINTKLSYKTTPKVMYYNSYFITFLKGKINIALRYLNIEYGDDFKWKYTYIAKFNDNEYYEVLSDEDIEYIEVIKELTKLKLVAKHNDDIMQVNKEKGIFNVPKQSWKDIGFKYRKILYNEIEEDLKNQKNISNLYKVLIIENKVNKSYLKRKEPDLNTIRVILKNKMEEYIERKKDNYVDDIVIAYHNKLFNTK